MAVETAPTPSPAPERTTEEISFSDGVHADLHYADMRWQIYDMTAFREKADRLSAASDAEEAQELLDWLWEEYRRLDTWYNLIQIEFYAGNGLDGALADALQQTDEMLTEAGDTLYSAVSRALEGAAGEALSGYLGESAAEAYADYEEMTDREIELWNRESELEIAYDSLLSQDDLSEPSLNYRVGSILLELVSIRNELAELYGYDSYADYAYEAFYGRDFTPADAQRLCDAVKPYARRYYRDCYYSDAFQHSVSGFSAGELMDLLREYAQRISPRAVQAQQYMEDHGLYMLDMAGVIYDTGYTTTLSLYNAPFLYNCLYGNFYDFTDTFHEFGHYYDAFINPEPEDVEYSASYDIFEIHSTSLEGLMYSWYDEVFGSEAETARIWCLDHMIESVIYGCIFDEFQQYVYANPDLTVEQINMVYRTIAESYGREFYNSSDSFGWMYVGHNISSPFYYLSYAVSILASLQLWSLAQDDLPAAIEKYNELVEKGAYEIGYCQLMREMDMALFTEDLDACIARPLQTLRALCADYDRRAAAA